MSSLTSISSLPYPALTDSPNVPSDMSNLAAALDHLVIPKYASAVAQTAANPAPADGDVWYRTDQSQGYIQRGTNALVLGDSHSKLQVQTLSTNTVMTFSSIPQNFTHLRLYLVAGSAAGSAHTELAMNFNNDVSATYNYHYQYESNLNSGGQVTGDGATFIDIGAYCAGVGTLGAAGVGVIDIFGYTNTTITSKQVLFQSHESGGFNSPTQFQSGAGGGLWGNTSAITSIKISSTTSTNLSIGSYGILYGLG